MSSAISLEKRRRGASAPWAGGDLGNEAAQAERLQDLLSDHDFLGSVAAGARRERDADGVADAFGQEDGKPRGAGDDAFGAQPRFGEAEVEWEVAAAGQASVDLHQILDAAHLGGEDDVLVRQADLFGQRGGAQRALEHCLDVDVAGVVGHGAAARSHPSSG